MISKVPPILSSKIFPKTEGESNSGRQHQSIEPFLEIKAVLGYKPDEID